MSYKRVLDINDLGSDDSDSDREEYNYSRHGDISDALLSENGDTDLSTMTLRTSEQSVAQDTQRVATNVSTGAYTFWQVLPHLLYILPLNNNLFSRESEQTAHTGMERS